MASPAASSSPASRRRRRGGPRLELRIWVLGFLMLCALSAVAARLWWVQVARGPYYAAKIAGRSLVTVRIPSVRGEIRDRNGVALVTNRASYEVDFYLPDMVRGFKDRSPGPVPQIEYQAPVRGMLKKKTEPDIVQIVNTAVVPRLQELELAKDYNSKRLRIHFRNNTEVPFPYIEDIDFPTIARFSEHDVGLPGVDIAVRPVRQYLYGALATHILGYVGMPVEIDREEAAKFNFYQPDVEGKSQVELAMDKWLRGSPGVRVMQRNVKGMIEGEVRTDPPKPGNNVYLTIDARIQFIAEEALRKGGIGRGAAVVVDPNNGDILAMASVPSYDPNVFIPSISEDDWTKINDDDTDPLTNRAVSSYAPGSTYKILTALAGLRKGIGRHAFTCSGGVTYGNKFMKCWVVDKHMSPHGTIGLSESIKVSCNAFYYQYGNAAGIDQINAVGDALSLGQKTGIEVTGESPGILPGPEWLKINYPREKWSNGHTANVSIGQGYVLASPLQMCMVAATVANGGIAYQPRLIDRVLDPEGRPVLDEAGKPVVSPPKIRTDLRAAGVTAEQVELVKRGMWQVVNEKGGTAKAARIPGVEVAGKTGTAQFWRKGQKDNHTWFICFAPFDKPKYAVCVFVQGAKAGGAVSAPIAARILEKSLAIERGYSPELVALKPAPGSFRFIDHVNFTDTAVPAQYAAEPEESADHTQAPDEKLASQGRQVVRARPDIRAKADAQGRVSVRRAQAVAPSGAPPQEQQERRSLIQRIFRPERRPPPAAEQTPPPQRRPRWPF